MKRNVTQFVIGTLLLVGLLHARPCGAGQYVEITAEVSADDWSFWFRTGQRNKENSMVPTIFGKTDVRRCVVGLDSWLLEATYQSNSVAYWFTGTNIITHRSHGNRKFVHTDESNDGNPGRRGGVADIMTFDPTGRFFWLALCSGPYLKHEGRKIYPPHDDWKESRIFYCGWNDQTTVFNDSLSLPSSVKLNSTNDQSVFQYQTRQTTNVMGWTFPLEFYGVQYQPEGSNGWKVLMTLKGRITSIRPTTKPLIPENVLKSSEPM